MIKLKKCSGASPSIWCWNDNKIDVNGEDYLTLDQFTENPAQEDGLSVMCVACQQKLAEDAEREAKYSEAIDYLVEHLKGESIHALLYYMSERGLIQWTGEDSITYTSSRNETF